LRDEVALLVLALGGASVYAAALLAIYRGDWRALIGVGRLD
jgi:hypothetical protein